MKEENEANWARDAKENVAAIKALGDWTTDDWELQEAVDQSQFYNNFGFNYDSERFDKYYDAEDY